MLDGGRHVIADTSPLQYLFQVGLLDLLPTLYGEVTIPEAVVRELAEGRARGVAVPDPAVCSWIRAAAVRDLAEFSFPAALGPGEREALALAAKNPGSVLLIDDALARRQARLLALTFSGTLGVLLRAKESGYLSAVGPVLVNWTPCAFASTRRHAPRCCASLARALKSYQARTAVRPCAKVER